MQENGSVMSLPPPQRLPSCMLAARRLLPQSHNETCSDADYNETVLSIFARKAFDRPNRVAVDANGTTKVSSGQIHVEKTAVPGGLEMRLLPCLTTMGRNRFLRSTVVR